MELEGQPTTTQPISHGTSVRQGGSPSPLIACLVIEEIKNSQKRKGDEIEEK